MALGLISSALALVAVLGFLFSTVRSWNRNAAILEASRRRSIARAQRMLIKERRADDRKENRKARALSRQ